MARSGGRSVHLCRCWTPLRRQPGGRGWRGEQSHVRTHCCRDRFSGPWQIANRDTVASENIACRTTGEWRPQVGETRCAPHATRTWRRRTVRRPPKPCHRIRRWRWRRTLRGWERNGGGPTRRADDEPSDHGSQRRSRDRRHDRCRHRCRGYARSHPGFARGKRRCQRFGAGYGPCHGNRRRQYCPCGGTRSYPLQGSCVAPTSHGEAATDL